jgi:hypothetical protein
MVLAIVHIGMYDPAVAVGLDADASARAHRPSSLDTPLAASQRRANTPSLSVPNAGTIPPGRRALHT